jgi:rhodanese-related sulfurtransferase
MRSLFFFVIIFIHAGVYSQKGIIMIDVGTFNELTSELEVQLLDVRTSKEYKEGNIKGSVNIDFWKPDFLEQVKNKFDKSKPLYIYCAGGGRSGMASENLKKKGFKLIYDLDGGYEAYLE